MKAKTKRTNTKLFTKGFNFGYLIAIYDQFAGLVMTKSFTINNDFILGMRHGLILGLKQNFIWQGEKIDNTNLMMIDKKIDEAVTSAMNEGRIAKREKVKK